MTDVQDGFNDERDVMEWIESQLKNGMAAPDNFILDDNGQVIQVVTQIMIPDFVLERAETFLETYTDEWQGRVWHVDHVWCRSQGDDYSVWLVLLMPMKLTDLTGAPGVIRLR